ncbi:hypothetical protein [Encephalitozoon cuniculi GB-M1]|uniref:Uncharacterized protein n=1 Tax=Encephalitozoon cuniculi (strain GB-M1) TaxID=284813 RepID=Q8SU45_ENCCU|nr:uncharacterized protein ECU11_0970 [Encephalitozoon cuniculi GB-M1]CAD26007.1 hypothetical protein [Encephalitozoon cuniculi GB-M1]
MVGKRDGQILMREIGRADPLLKDLLYVSSFASVYRHANGEWNKLNIEGTFVMYTRALCPPVGIHVFNRKSLKDFTLYLTKDIRFGVKGNFMTLSDDESGEVYGLWLHSDAHPGEVLRCLEELL